MKRILRLLAGLSCIVLTVLTGGRPISLKAEETQLPERKVPPYILDIYQECTLEIQTDVGRNTAGAELMVYQVGKIDATSLSLSFVLDEKFEGSKADLMAEGNAKRSQAIETLYQYVKDHKIEPFQRVQLDDAGAARLIVPQGAYLICQIEEGETKIQASLVGVPCVDQFGSSWQYQMKVQLKANLGSVPTGDTQNEMMYVGLAGIAVVLLATLLLARKRCCKSRN